MQGEEKEGRLLKIAVKHEIRKPIPGYDNPSDAADGVRRKWGSNLNLAENGDLEF